MHAKRERELVAKSRVVEIPNWHIKRNECIKKPLDNPLYMTRARARSLANSRSINASFKLIKRSIRSVILYVMPCVYSAHFETMLYTIRWFISEFKD